MMEDPREHKLPKWAQEELSSLRSRLDTVKNEAAILRNAKPTRVYSQAWTEIETKRFLDDRAPVYFETDNGTVYVHFRENILHISAHGPVLIESTASNCFYLTIKR
jgi:hypothetical protein